MTPALIDATWAGGYRIHLRYDNGRQSVVDLEGELRGADFEPLRDVAKFKVFRVNRELQTISWPNGADLAPELLRERATG